MIRLPKNAWMIAVGVLTFATLFAAAFHFAMIKVLPDPFFEPDSSGYFGPVLSYIENGLVTYTPRRLPGYSLFLYPILKSGGFKSVLVTQHLLVFVTALLAGFIYRRFFKGPLLAAWAMGILIVLQPRLMHYAHTVMSETVFTTLFIGVLAWMFFAIEKPHPWVWAVFGLGVGACVLVKVSTLPLIPAFLAGVLFIKSREQKLRAAAAFSTSLIISLVIMCSVNARVHGFWRLSQGNEELLFSTSAYLLDPQQIEDESVRNALLPVYQNFPEKMRDAAWIVFDEAGLVNALRKLDLPKGQYLTLIRRLARQGILSHPVRYVIDYFKWVSRYLLIEFRRPTYFSLPKEFLAWKSLSLFWEKTQPSPVAAGWVSYKPEQHQDYFKKIAGQTLYPYDPLWILRPIEHIGIVYPAAVYLLAILLAVKKKLDRRVVFLLILIAVHFTGVTLSGLDWRYVIPVEPLMFLLLFVTLRDAVKLASKMINSSRPVR